MGCLFSPMKQWLLPASVFVTAASVVSAQPVEFNRDIRPILTHHCTACHGGVKEAGGISFIMREGALATGESGRQPVVPGDTAKSEMLRRIRSTDPDELAAFESAHAADPAAARAQAVDRLLASPGYGERWAAMWLDLARYADTYGFEKDPHRNIWPWRDWEIRAFNSDMPFDQFTIEQLAGDLLPDVTADQRLATAFHRNTQSNAEDGTDDEEFRVAAVIDRVSTTWTTWQGTTFGCVQCHSHPYDPIDHREFYQFTAFFDSTLDCDQNDDFPRMKIADDPEQRDALSDLETRIRDTRLRINRGGREIAKATTDWQPFIPDTFAPSHGTLAVDGDGTIRSQGIQRSAEMARARITSMVRTIPRREETSAAFPNSKARAGSSSCPYHPSHRNPAAAWASPSKTARKPAGSRPHLLETSGSMFPTVPNGPHWPQIPDVRACGNHSPG
jgi:hypothetical protein